MTGMFLTN